MPDHDEPPPHSATTLLQEFVRDYGEAYQRFGLPRLMGRIVGLLLLSDEPRSLDGITAELQVSKGPVSQIMRRLRDNNLVQRVDVPGSRRDHYRADPDIFGRAFANHAALLGRNLHLARKYAAMIAACDGPVPDVLVRRTDEMVRFYSLMERHLAAFLAEWESRNAGNGTVQPPEETP